MADYSDILLRLTKRLYPRGRAFKMPTNGVIEKTNKALIVSQNTAYTAALSVLDSILPDNDNFTTDDASDWERRLGLPIDTGATLADRKLAIERKINHPGDILARQHYLYVQGQLQAAGFNVWVHENKILDGGIYYALSPDQVIGVNVEELAVHRTDLQHGETNHGGGFKEKIVNSLDANVDRLFDVGDNYRSTFFIGGEVIGTFANIDATRETEFRQLVLKLKPAQTVAYPFVNYI